MALAVAKGDSFLGCQTAQGSVVYLALEEKRSEVRAHFADLGATGEEPIYTHCAAAPQDGMSELCQKTKELKPLLVLVDPLFKFLRVKDEKAYAEVCSAIEPLLTLARETGAHVMLLHHNGKAERVDAMDAILGSTAIFGGVDTAIILKKSDRYRTIQSSQKYGEDIPETTLGFDASTRALSLALKELTLKRYDSPSRFSTTSGKARRRAHGRKSKTMWKGKRSTSGRLSRTYAQQGRYCRAEQGPRAIRSFIESTVLVDE